MSEEKSKEQKPREILFLFIGFMVFFAVILFIPEEIKILRVTGFLYSAAILIISLIMMFKKRKELQKDKHRAVARD